VRISRLYVPDRYEEGALLKVQGEACHYVKSVLRLRKGWQLILFDGQGSECLAILEGFGRDSVQLRLQHPLKIDRESHLSIHLALGVSRGERMDLAIQKAVELGVTEISPLLTDYAVVKLDDARKTNRLAHWTGVVRSACEQSGRNLLPVVNPVMLLEEWMPQRRKEVCECILDPLAPLAVGEIPPPPGRVTLMVGPEGGFSDQERLFSIESGFKPMKLGPRVLRTETAVIAAITLFQTLWGDLASSSDRGRPPNL
jgi:16S rRNA (uracil1498-N3)-methyltransferase